MANKLRVSFEHIHLPQCRGECSDLSLALTGDVLGIIFVQRMSFKEIKSK